jgi:hypothetical protein
LSESPQPAFLRVRNWSRFQYRSDKRLPWIRDYDDQLEKPEYVMLTDAERGQLKDLRLLANRTGNKIPNDPAYVRNMIRSRSKRLPNLRKFQQLGFLEEWRSESVIPANQHISSAQGAHETREEGAADRDDRFARDESSSGEFGEELLKEIDWFGPTPQQMKQIVADPGSAGTGVHLAGEGQGQESTRSVLQPHRPRRVARARRVGLPRSASGSLDRPDL